MRASHLPYRSGSDRRIAGDPHCRDHVPIPLILVAAALLAATFAAPLHAAKAPPKKQTASEYDAGIKSKSSELDSIKAELRRSREELARLQSREGTQVEQLELLSGTIRTAEHYVLSLSVKIDSLDRGIARLEDSLSAAAARLASRQAAMSSRLRTMYETSPVRIPEGLRMLDIVLSSGGRIDEALYRIRYFQELGEYDRVLLREIDSTKAAVQTHKSRLEQRRALLAALRKDKEHERTTLASEEATHQKLLSEIRTKKELYTSMVRQLEAAQAQLKGIIETLMKQRKKTGTAAPKTGPSAAEKKKGNLPWPVTGEVVAEFGKVVHPVYKTVTMNNGIDILGTAGQSVSCVAAGKVLYIGTMRGLGNFLMVDHGNDLLTIYAHIEGIAVKKDQQVQAGTKLGTVAASSEGAKLHFEVRRLAQPLDPRAWLR